MLSKVDEHLKQYLSFFISPPQFDSQEGKNFSHLKIFDCIGTQPPTTLSLMITKNFLDWCLDKEKFEVFKKVLQTTLATVVFWFDNNHPYLCDFYENLSAYYQTTGAIQQSINYMKESLAIGIKSGGVTSKKTGYKYFNLAQKQLRAGRKNDSMDNFIKAKNNMENYNDQTIKYPITLMKLSSLYLNMSQFENCIIYSKQAVQKFEDLQAKAKAQQRAIPKGYYDQYCIKAIQIMTRAYQIQNKKNQFYRVAQLASAKYNRTTNAIVFQQLVKICFTSVIFKNPLQKCQVFQNLVQKIKQSNNQGERTSPQTCLNELINLSQQFNVMQRFMFKFESLQRIASDVNSRRTLSADSKQFVNITRNIVGAIGQDYVYGLIQQKEFQ